MQVYDHWSGLKNKYEKLVVGLGNFDGVHIGHQKLITGVTAYAAKIGGTPAVITFHPHPMAVIHPENCPPLLLNQEYKHRLIAGLQVKVLLELPFDHTFANILPEDFIREILYEGLGAKGVVVGYNFTFGRFGKGDPALLEALAEKYDYRLIVLPPVRVGKETVSSSLIREMMISGQVDRAAAYLGYNTFVEGKVVTGEKRGGAIGFPTANLNIKEDALVPANGVYSVKVIYNNESYPGVANIGCKPTFNGNTRIIEAHLLGYSGDLYGSEIKVEFVGRIRDEIKFSSADELVNQIRKDVEAVRNS